LMPGNHGGFTRRKLALDDVKVRAAHPAHLHAHEDLALAGARVGLVYELEGIRFDRRGRT